MAALNSTGRVEANGCLTIPKETIDELGVRPGDSLNVFLSPNPPAKADVQDGGEDPPETLADLLGDYIGAVQGNGESTQNAGEQFTDYLVQKHREGRL